MLDLYRIEMPYRITGIYTAFDNVWESGMTFKGESHDFWEIVTVLSGRMEAVEDDRYYVLESGMTVCHAPGEFHRIKSVGAEPSRFSVITFRNKGELPERLKEGVFVLGEENLDEYLNIFYPLNTYYRECRSKLRMSEPLPLPDFAERQALLRLELFLLRLSESTVSEGRQSMSESAREYRRLVRTMTRRVADNLSLSRLAEIHHISESYVKKLFHTYAGEGAMVYYGRLRTSEIKRLLDEGLSVSEITERMNFSSASYLSTFFKKQTGITPCAYAEKGSGKPKKLL
jgi:AraC-like DNA-binding protein